MFVVHSTQHWEFRRSAHISPLPVLSVDQLGERGKKLGVAGWVSPPGASWQRAWGSSSRCCLLGENPQILSLVGLLQETRRICACWQQMFPNDDDSQHSS